MSFRVQIEQMVMGAFWEACLNDPSLCDTEPHEYARFVAPLIRSNVVDALDLVRAKEALDRREAMFNAKRDFAIKLFEALAHDGEYNPKHSPTRGDFVQEMKRNANELRRI